MDQSGVSSPPIPKLGTPLDTSNVLHDFQDILQSAGLQKMRFYVELLILNRIIRDDWIFRHV
jgi:hypothetical protein